MRCLRFEWNQAKAAENRAKHGITFREAVSVFLDECARIIPDPDHSETEARFILLGMSATLRILVVSHCYREETDTIRIISARKATKTERLQYGVH